MRNKSLALLLLFLLPAAVFSQDLGEIIFGKGNKASYIGQYTDNHKHQSGIGIMRMKKGAVYIGDFNMDKFSGKGMLIAGQEGIKNCPGAAYYVGSFFNNMKNRKGICYAANGDIIYKGRFENDAPVDTYPTPNPVVEDYYTMLEMGEELFWGEVTCGVPNGSALVLETDGSLWVGEYKDGVRTGLCLTCFDNENWEAGKWENGVYTAIDNSNVAQARNQERKTAQRRAYAEMWSSLMDVAMGITEIGNQLAQMNQSATEGYDDAGGSGAAGSSGSAKKGSKAGSKAGGKSDCGTSWMSDSRTYSNYETLQIRDGYSKDIGNKMRAIRLKWEKRGCKITQSPHE